MRSVQFWCGFTATQYAIPPLSMPRTKRMKSAAQGDAQLGPKAGRALLEQRLIASAAPVRNFGLRAAVQGRYSIAVPQRFFLPAHVGLRLTAVCGTRCRWEYRTRQRPAGDHRQA